MRRVAVVPSAPALLAAYAGRIDPMPQVRAAALAAVRWLVDGRRGPVDLLSARTGTPNVRRGAGDPVGSRVGRELLAAAGFAGHVAAWPQPGPLPPATAAPLLVVANGSARRSPQAPGYLDDRAAAFDDHVERALTTGDARALVDLDPVLAADLLVTDLPAFRALGAWAPGRYSAIVDLAADPFGVRYWVARWSPVD